MKLPEKIIAARHSIGITQEELALRSKVTVRTIQRIENGQTIPRMYTLRAIANTLDLPFNEIDSVLRKNNTDTMDESDTIHFLRMLCLSCFSYLIIPYIHFLIPQYLLRKEKRLHAPALSFARDLIRKQIWWVVLFHSVLLLTVSVNFFLINYGNGTILIHYLWVVFVAYIINFITITNNFFRIKAINGLKPAL